METRGVEEDFFNAVYPLGFVYIGTNAPNFGSWDDLGEWKNGEVLLLNLDEGSTIDGSCMKHQHRVVAQYSTNKIVYDHNDEKCIGEILVTNSSGAEELISATFDIHGTIDIELYTECHSWLRDEDRWSDSDGRNLAGGVYVGSGAHIWKRKS